MKQRFITGLVLMSIFIPLLIIDKLFNLFQILLMVLSFIASMEMVKMFSKRKDFPKLVKVAIMAFTILIYLSGLAEYAPLSISGEFLELFNISIDFNMMLVAVVVILFSLMVMYDDFDGNQVGRALTSIIYCGLGFASLTILRFIGLRFVIYLFIITISTDVFAYLFGMRFGKHKMAPKISPKKSWEGAIGGTVTATILGFSFALFYGKIMNDDVLVTLFHGIDVKFFSFYSVNKIVQVFFIFFTTVFVSIFGQIGDLVASKFKRTYEIKDFGNIFPGHGGVLDRLDSAIFAAMFLLCAMTITKNFIY